MTWIASAWRASTAAAECSRETSKVAQLGVRARRVVEVARRHYIVVRRFVQLVLAREEDGCPALRVIELAAIPPAVIVCQSCTLADPGSRRA